MNRRDFLGWLAGAGAAISLGRAGQALAEADMESTAHTSESFPPIDKSKSEWRELLEPARYGVLFEEKTERAYSSALNDEKRDGKFVCAACYLPLFESKTKYDSGTGWPSFYDPIPGRLGTKTDYWLIYPRTEYHCARCGGHQGHVFDDGPPPTGKRYCNNGLALLFVPSDEKLPELRS